MSKKPVAAWYWQDQNLIMHAYVQSKASKDEWVGLHENAIKIRVRAAAVDNRANQNLCSFVAKQFGVAKTQVSILNGHTCRRKTIRIQSPRKYPAFIHRQDSA
jgi:uncharacterized protein (TIGR00251 family)